MLHRRWQRRLHPGWQLLLIVGSLSVLGLLALWASMAISPPSAVSPESVSTTQYTDLPGIDLEGLSEMEREELLTWSNQEPCTCGCGFTLAACRHRDPHCKHSAPILAGWVRARRESRREGSANERESRNSMGAMG